MGGEGGGGGVSLDLDSEYVYNDELRSELECIYCMHVLLTIKQLFCIKVTPFTIFSITLVVEFLVSVSECSLYGFDKGQSIGALLLQSEVKILMVSHQWIQTLLSPPNNLDLDLLHVFHKIELPHSF